MKHLIFAIAIAFSVFAAKAATLNEPCDLATVTPAAYETISCKASTTNVPYTLSADVSWGSQTLSVTAGSMIFDFTDGGHTLGVKSFNIASSTSPYVELKGGALDGLNVGSYGEFLLNTSSYDSSDRTVVLDSVSISNIRRVHLLRGRNGTLLLRNGASLTATEFWPFDDLADATLTNNLIHVSGGSVLGLVAAIDCSWEKSGSGTAALMNNRLLVEGSGSLFVGTKAYNTFKFGNFTSGNGICVRDGGGIEWYNAIIGGSQNAKSNTIVVTGSGSSIVGGGSLVIGSAEGADYNRVVIADGGDLKTQIYNGTTVGSAGSFNELIISNATLSRTYWVTAGAKAGASNNLVKVYGDASVTPTGYHHFFGAGQHNVFSFEHGTFYPSGDYYATMSTREYKDGAYSGAASTNNQFQVVDGASIRFYDFRSSVWDATNTVFVGADSTLSVAHDMPLRGSGNRLVISNGTVKCSQSSPGLCLGSTADEDTGGFAEEGNVLVFQGTHPLIQQYDPQHSSTVRLCDHAILRFEVPEEGYPGPLTKSVGFYICGNGAIEFSGVEKLAANLQKATDYQLTDSGLSVSNPEEGVTIEKIVEAANVGMPRGSYAYLASGNKLYLHVKPIRGMLLIVR